MILAGFDGLVARAALGVQETEQFLQNGGVGGVPQKGAFAAYRDQILILELFQVVRQRGGRNVQFALDLANHHAIRMRGQKRAQDPQARLRTQRREHVRIARRTVRVRGNFRFDASIVLYNRNIQFVKHTERGPLRFLLRC